jgi:hypothetical protein
MSIFAGYTLIAVLNFFSEEFVETKTKEFDCLSAKENSRKKENLKKENSRRETAKTAQGKNYEKPPGPNVIKLFTAVIYQFLYKLRFLTRASLV